MKISGTASLQAPVERVWEAFNDPTVLARTLPGCQSLTELAPDSYRMTITAGVASIKGTYDGEVALRDKEEPSAFTLCAKGSGTPGTVTADVRVRLAPSATGGTDLSYDADAVVGGMIGGVGQRMLTGVSKKMAGQFFQAVDADLTGVSTPVPTAPYASQPAPAVAAAPRSALTPAPADNVVGSLDARSAILGGALALLGVAVGALIGRRK